MLVAGSSPHAALLNSGYNTPEEKYGSARIVAGVSSCAHGCGIVPVDDLCPAASSHGTRRAGPSFQSRAAAEEHRFSANPRQRTALGQQRSVSLPVARLRAGREDPQHHLSAAVLLLL